MQKTVSDTFTHYTIELIDESIASSETIPLDIISEFFHSVESRQLDPSLLFEINDEIEYCGNELSGFEQSLSEISSFPEGSYVLIKMTAEKADAALQIFDPQAFVDSLKKYSLSEQLALIENNIFGKDIQTREQVITHHELSSYYTGLKLVSNIEAIYKEVTNSEISPLYIHSLAQKLQEGSQIRHYLVQIRDLFSLALLTERVEFLNSSTIFHFSNDKKSLYDHNEQKHIVNEHIFEVMTWVFEDDSYNIKKAIFNNVMSMQASTLSAINNELLSVLKSNLRILYKDKFSDYLEAKNGITDFLFELSNKLKDQINSNTNASTRSILAVMSFYFTSTIFTAIDKGKFVNVFTYEVSVMSTVFVLGAMIYLAFQQRQFENYLTFHLSQKKEFQDRYKDIFSSEELKRLFSPPSLTELIKCAKSRADFYAYQVFLAILGGIAWVLHLSLTM
ncbi:MULTISPECIES: hypothetical protein [Vibrio]|uniref:hypothetical protein n=1 Tax=Vibrio TaxID=662 RepID=UPI000C860554|nr:MULTISPECIES: hypothetical protein [Vibrio]MEC7307411.1 hypothetical protein [Vibrio crassostreae]PME34504.1 hypothetical protein BCV39_20510 [Vibrio sp. 10N.286.55.E10]PME34982.1 hypothetical protein BCV40_09980 [Vibrio sp. 10N.286.55.E12]PME68674.1 hypothetical protein BCV32_12265 [Vibrio sp. 10N.286.55.C11]TCV23694.1 hypothetical protein EDB71_113102 [Vibrio crassostreae]